MPTVTRAVPALLAALLPLLVGGCLSAPWVSPHETVITPREGYLEGAGGARIFYKVAGSGPDTVVAIHGGPGGNMGNFGTDLEPLTRNHVVIFWDQRGGGRSELPADTALLDARHSVGDLDALRRYFRMEKMTLLAHSFGPVLAARYAQEHPERVARMILVGSIGPSKRFADEYGRRFYGRMDTALARQTFMTVKALMDGTAPDPAATCREYERLQAQAGEARGEPKRGTGTNCDAPADALKYSFAWTSRITYASYGAWDYTTGALSNVTAPVLVIRGETDPTPLESDQAWARAVPNGRLLVITGAGHAPHAERPDVFFPAVEAFLAGGWPEGVER